MTGFDVGPVGDPTSVEVCPADPNQGDVTVVQSPVDADAEAGLEVVGQFNIGGSTLDVEKTCLVPSVATGCTHGRRPCGEMTP